MPKPRILYLAWTPPTTNGGACLAMHRHFVLHHDFELFVASTNLFKHSDIPSFHVQRHPLLKRLSNTRFSRLIHQIEMLLEPQWVLNQVEPLLREFKPDAIFTIPDNTISWTAYLLAQKSGIPLITNFQDWWPRGQFTLAIEQPYKLVIPLLERRFYRMYQQSALAFCTSAGMRQKLGNHSNAPILFPCPDPRNTNIQSLSQPPSKGKPLKLIYTGTIVNAYGRSILNLAKQLRGSKKFEFHVYGPHPDWPQSDLKWMEEEGVYRGLLPFDKLKSKLREADICLVVMSFEPNLRLMMETSFTTKFLEYSQYGKPILVWGPEYCQPIQVARAQGAGLPVDSQKVEAVVSALHTLQDPQKWQLLAEGSAKAGASIFHPDKIHAVLRDSIYSLLN